MDHHTLRELGQQLRVDSVRIADTAGSGHPTSSMSAADLMAMLVANHLRYDFAHPDDPNNDELIFSKGHASPLLYALYKAVGAVAEDELDTYRQLGSRLEGHPTPRLPWVAVATGSLGQGLLPYGIGFALAGKRLDRLDYRTWVLCGDSEMAEGSMWEAFEHAAFEGLDHLTAIIDVNRLGQTCETMHGWDLDAYADRARAIGWHAITIDEAYREADRDRRPHRQGQWGVAGGQPQRLPRQAAAGRRGRDRRAGRPSQPRGAGPVTRQRCQTPPLSLWRGGAATLGGRDAGGDADGVRRGPGGTRHRARRCRRARRRGQQLDEVRGLRRGPPRALLRDVHRRAQMIAGAVGMAKRGWTVYASTFAAMADLDGISYIRTTRGNTPVINDADEQFPVGGSKVLRSSSDDVITVVAAGVTVHEVLAAADQLADDGINVRVVDAYSVKPVDVDTLRTVARETRGMVTVEDHRPQGGLGEAVMAALADTKARPRIVQCAVREMPGSATPAEQVHAQGLDAEGVVAAVRRLL